MFVHVHVHVHLWHMSYHGNIHVHVFISFEEGGYVGEREKLHREGGREREAEEQICVWEGDRCGGGGVEEEEGELE